MLKTAKEYWKVITSAPEFNSNFVSFSVSPFSTFPAFYRIIFSPPVGVFLFTFYEFRFFKMIIQPIKKVEELQQNGDLSGKIFVPKIFSLLAWLEQVFMSLNLKQRAQKEVVRSLWWLFFILLLLVSLVLPKIVSCLLEYRITNSSTFICNSVEGVRILQSLRRYFENESTNW